MVALVVALLLGGCASTKPDMAALKPTENTSTAVVKISYPSGGDDFVSRKEFDQAKTKLDQPGTPEQFILDDLASRHLMIHEARAKDIAADPKAVDQFVDRLRTQTCAKTPFPEAQTEKDPAKLLEACANFYGFEGTAGLRRYLQEQVLINNLIQKEAKPGEEIHAQHILVKTEAEAAKVHQRVTTGGEDFGKVAKEVSIDPSAKQNAGDLGFFGPGQMVPQFEKAAEALKNGEISQPVQSQFGWHVIKVIERRKADASSPDAMQAAGNAYRQSILETAKQNGQVKYLITPAPAPTQAPPPVELPTVEVGPDQTAGPAPRQPAAGTAAPETTATPVR